jgi:hypothetical protein
MHKVTMLGTGWIGMFIPRHGAVIAVSTRLPLSIRVEKNGQNQVHLKAKVQR